MGIFERRRRPPGLIGPQSRRDDQKQYDVTEEDVCRRTAELIVRHVFPENDNHDHGQYGRDTHQVYSRGEPGQEHYQEDKLPVVGAVRLFVPGEHEPDDKEIKQRGGGKIVCFHGTEPERVAEREPEGTDRRRPERSERIERRLRILSLVVADQLDRHKVEEKNRQCARHDGHQVHPQADITRNREHEEKPPDEGEKRTSRRMRHLEHVCRGGKFARVPERDGRLHRQEVLRQGNGKNDGRSDSVDEPVIHWKIPSKRCGWYAECGHRLRCLIYEGKIKDESPSSVNVRPRGRSSPPSRTTGRTRRGSGPRAPGAMRTPRARAPS